MHDWKKIVQTSLTDLRLPPHEEEEVLRELADHLQDEFDRARAIGLSERMAFQQCTKQLDGVREAARRIEISKRKEVALNYRTKTLWVPGLVTLTAAVVLDQFCYRVPFLQPRVWWIDEGAIVLSLQWIILLPFCGALGFHISQRAGSGRLNAFLAAAFPALVTLGIFCIALLFGIAKRETLVFHHPLYLGLALLKWIVVPGASLLLGTLAVLRKRLRQT